MPCGIHELPNELLDQILNLLDQPDLGRLGLVCRVLHARCTPLLYKEVTFTYLTARRNMNIIDDPMMEENNEQPQKTLISILKTLSEKTWLAAHVRSIKHVCRMVYPDPSSDLQQGGTSGASSLNGDLLALLRSACANMVNVRALKIISGQFHIAQGIICGLRAETLEKLTINDFSQRVGCDWGYSDIFRGQFMMLRREDPYPLPSRHDDPVLPFRPASYQGVRRHILETVAIYQGESIQELELCGLVGGPALWTEQRRTDTGFFGRLRGDGRGSCCLSPLRNLHKLRKLTLGFRLATYFERVDRDEEVKEFWRSSGSPASTALVVVGEEPRLHTWARILQTTYEPVNIAQRIADFVGHFVSLRAKEQEGGVHIVGKLCMKTSGSRFNVDLWLGRRANEREQLLRWTRPTEDIDG
ncbi:hypothetical protein MBLNU457_4834t2 [Dothideomycetes sp. NU457]